MRERMGKRWRNKQYEKREKHEAFYKMYILWKVRSCGIFRWTRLVLQQEMSLQI